MTVELNNLESRLLKTRDNLTDVCEELGLEQPDEDSLSVLCCVNCSLWQLRKFVRIEDDIPVCNFCADMAILKF